MVNSLKVSDGGIEEIVKHEGEILHVYADPVGLPTLGVGHLLTPAERKRMPLGTKITKAESRAYLRKDLVRFEQCVNETVKVGLNQNQFDALVSLAFNIGEDNFERSTLLKILNRGQYALAAEQFTKWVRAGGDVLPGLVTRRKKEKALFLKKVSSPVTDSAADSRPTAQPDPVSGDAQDDPNLSTAASPSNSSSSAIATREPDESIGSTLNGAADVITGALNKAGNIQEGVARASFLSRFWRGFLTAFGVVTAYISTNWEVFLLLLLVSGIFAWYWFVVRPRRSGGLGTE